MALAAIVLLGLPFRLTDGQVDSGGIGRIRGTVYDSLLHAPLEGAWVSLGDGTRRVQSDQQGRYLLDTVPAGTHVVWFWRADLDSAGLWSLGDTVSVMAGQQATRNLAVPSLPTIWSRLCGVAWVPGTPDSGVIVGMITDAATREPASEARPPCIGWRPRVTRMVACADGGAERQRATGRFARGCPPSPDPLLRASRPVRERVRTRVGCDAFQTCGRAMIVTLLAADLRSGRCVTATLAGRCGAMPSSPAGAVVRVDDLPAISEPGRSLVLRQSRHGDAERSVSISGAPPGGPLPAQTTTITAALWSVVPLTQAVVERMVSAPRARESDRRGPVRICPRLHGDRRPGHAPGVHSFPPGYTGGLSVPARSLERVVLAVLP
jgi:hypothetical protein